MAQDWFAMRREIEAKLIARTWADASFKAALLKNPTQTINDFITSEGYTLPDSALKITYRVIEETPTSMVLTLPPTPDNLELSDEELDAVAGGILSCSSAY